MASSPPAIMTTAEFRASESEASLQTWLIDYARTHGWRVAHFRAAQTAKGWRTPVEADGKGFPDLVLVRKGFLIFAELKSEKAPKKLPADEDAWRMVLEEVAFLPSPVRYFVWRPSDRPQIERVLS